MFSTNDSAINTVEMFSESTTQKTLILSFGHVECGNTNSFIYSLENPLLNKLNVIERL